MVLDPIPNDIFINGPSIYCILNGVQGYDIKEEAMETHRFKLKWSGSGVVPPFEKFAIDGG